MLSCVYEHGGMGNTVVTCSCAVFELSHRLKCDKEADQMMLEHDKVLKVLPKISVIYQKIITGVLYLP